MSDLGFPDLKFVFCFTFNYVYADCRSSTVRLYTAVTIFGLYSILTISGRIYQLYHLFLIMLKVRGSFKRIYLLLQNFVNIKASHMKCQSYEICHLCSPKSQLYIYGKSNFIQYLLLSLHGKS